MLTVTCFWVVVVINRCSLLDHGTLKSVKNQFMKWAYFLHADTNYWVGMFKNGGDLLDHGTIKSDVSQKSFDESRLIEWLLHTDSHSIIFGFITNLLSIFRSIPPEGLLRKGVLKKCKKFIGEQPCRNAIWIKLQSSFIEITLQHGFSPKNLLIFREHLFLRMLLEGCFCIFYICWVSPAVVLVKNDALLLVPL